MTTNTLSLDSQELQESFQAWREQEDSLDAQWKESLAALEAYQSHLDAWQNDLAQERDELRIAREDLERDREAIEQNLGQDHDDTAADSSDERNEIAALTNQLAARTEEFQEVDRLRAELAAQLEAAQANSKELAAAVEEQRQTLERERSTWTDQLHHMRELLEQRGDSTPAERQEEAFQSSKTAPEAAPGRSNTGGEKRAAISPVLGSIVEQFGKLRQQRASERQAGKRSG